MIEFHVGVSRPPNYAVNCYIVTISYRESYAHSWELYKVEAFTSEEGTGEFVNRWTALIAELKRREAAQRSLFTRLKSIFQ